MKIQTRAAIVPLVTVSLLCAGLYLLVSTRTVQSFSKLENEILNRQVERVNNSFENLVEEHALKIVDWAQWDKTYEFVDTLDKSYIEENLNALTVAALGYKSVLYYDLAGKLRYAITVEGDQVVPAEQKLVEEVAAVLDKSGSSTFKGAVRLRGKIMLFASGDILPNKADKPSRGTLVVLAEVPDETFASIAHMTNLSLSFFDAAKPQAESGVEQALVELRHGAPSVITAQSDTLAYAYGKIADYTGTTLLAFRIQNSRDITRSGSDVRWLSLLILSGSGILAALLLIGVIAISVTRRLQQFSQQVRQIAKTGDTTQSVEDTYRGRRSLRFQTAIGVLFIFVSLTIFAGTYLNRFFLGSFREVENKVVGDNVERGRRALEARLEKLKAKATDWGQWDDTYAFVEDRNEAYAGDNLGFDTLGRMNVKFVLYYDADGKLVSGVDVQAASESVAPVDAATAAAIGSVSQLVTSAEPTAGFVRLPSGTILAASSPILDTTRTKPRRGTLVFAALADDALAQELGHQTRLKLAFNPPERPRSSSTVDILPVSDDEIDGVTAVSDLAGKPALELIIRSLRPVYIHGLATVQVLPFYFVIAGALCALATMYWVDRVVLSRIRQLDSDVSEIELSGMATRRVTSTGSDELSGLADDINKMLATLQRTQEELQAARMEAESANYAKSMFIARVSHELRTPVGGIVGIHRIIKKHDDLPRSVRELVEMADLSAQGLLSIIDEILDFTKAEAGELTFEKIRFNVRHVARETMQTIAGRLEGKYRPEETDRVQLICDIDPTVPHAVIGDPTKIRQILTNLLGNSVKFTQSGSITLRIKLDQAASDANGRRLTLRFEIQDTGIGISPAKLGTIFEPYKQADVSVTRKYQGTGLGLSIVKQFTDALGGSVSVASARGSGSTFTVLLNFDEAKATPQDTAPRPHQTTIIALPSDAATTITRNLADLCASNVALLDPSKSGVTPAINEQLLKSDLVVISEEALALPAVANALDARIAENTGCTVALLSPSSLELRNKLYDQGLKHVLPTPVLADDVLAAFAGTLPVHDAPQASDRTVLAFGRPLTVLVVDDIPTNRIILEEMLEEAGHRVITASDGTEMVEHLTKIINGAPDAEPIDIVLTDVSMAIMDGDTATIAVRDLEKQSGRKLHIPIVAVTAHAFQEEQVRIREAGVDGILVKPIMPEKVAAELRRLLAVPAAPGGQEQAAPR